MYGYEESQDAHKTSNYNEWKAKHNVITDVEVDLSVVGVTEESVRILQGCISNGRDFIIYNDDDFMVFCPKYLANYHGATGRVNIYRSTKQMIDFVKLTMFTLTEIKVCDLQIGSSISLKQLCERFSINTNPANIPKTEKQG